MPYYFPRCLHHFILSPIGHRLSTSSSAPVFSAFLFCFVLIVDVLVSVRHWLVVVLMNISPMMSDGARLFKARRLSGCLLCINLPRVIGTPGHCLIPRRLRAPRVDSLVTSTKLAGPWRGQPGIRCLPRAGSVQGRDSGWSHPCSAGLESEAMKTKPPRKFFYHVGSGLINDSPGP